MWTVMFWCCLAGVLVLSLMPAGVQLPDTGWDKSNHLPGFCALACTGLMAYPKRPVIWLADLLAYGGMIGVLQSFTPDRMAEWADLLADGKRSINPALSVGGELRDACVHVEQRGHMRCRATQRY